MILEMFTPRRNFILLILYWQYLQMRLMLEGAASGGANTGPLNTAFNLVDEKITSTIGNPMCPALVRMVYGKIKQFAKHQVALPKPGEKPGMKCSIM